MDDLQLTRRLFTGTELDPDAKGRARARLEPLMHEPPRQRVWRRAGLVAAVIAGFMTLQVVLPPGGNGPAPSAAAELRRLATIAAQRTPEPGGPVAYSRDEEY